MRAELEADVSDYADVLFVVEQLVEGEGVQAEG